jgi:uncharacterized phage protein (predicted DNA packaging)
MFAGSLDQGITLQTYSEASIRHALLMLVAHWYENREASTETALQTVPMGVDMLLGNERVGWYG